jgi:hypothetical protein
MNKLKLVSLFLILSMIVIGCHTSRVSQKQINSYISEIYTYLDYDKHKDDIVFYVDLSKSSSNYRFYVINLKDSTIIDKGLCCNGKTDKLGRVMYSNKPGSNCSSKGLYKVGSSYIGRFGKAYELHGLSSTNSNVHRRRVVLHSYKGIPRYSVGLPICQSQGCPTVNPEFLKELSGYINKKKVRYLILS